MSPAARNGIEWDELGLDIVPVWSRQPNLEAIIKVCRDKLEVNTSEPCDVSFFAEGAFNKLYIARTNQRNALMRVSLPVHPHSKTKGEVTTLRFLRRETNIPVPGVFAFDDSMDNEIGFEWILMELMPGVSLYKKWRTLTAFQKAALVQRVADFQAQISRHRFSGIGTLTTVDNDKPNIQGPQPGELVATELFGGDHFDMDIPRGPFRSSHDWLSAYLEIVVKDHTTARQEAEDKKDEEDADCALHVAQRLLALLPNIFPSLQNPPERSVVWHQDLSLSNILVDEQGSVTAVLDWECVSAMPLWIATEAPKFLEWKTRDEEPNRASYADESDAGSGTGSEDDELDNEGKTDLYWIHLMEYETTQLRRLYNASMQQINASWNSQVEDGALKQDYAGAVFRCGIVFGLKKIAQWVDAIERGEYPRLMDVLKA